MHLINTSKWRLENRKYILKVNFTIKYSMTLQITVWLAYILFRGGAKKKSTFHKLSPVKNLQLKIFLQDCNFRFLRLTYSLRN